jgi:hypothetical protein
MPRAAFFYCHAECHYAECHYVECNYAKYHYAECLSTLSIVDLLIKVACFVQTFIKSS